MTHVYCVASWLSHPFSLSSFSLSVFLSLTLFNIAILSFPPISPSPTHFPIQFVCLPAIRSYRTELGRPNPNGISSYTDIRSLSLCSCLDLGQRSSSEVKGKGRNVGSKQYLDACEYVSIKVSGAQRQRRCPMSCQIRLNQKDISQGGSVWLPCTIDLFRHLDSIQNQSYMMRDRVVTN